jgi:phosphoribosylformylglycinamidine synthase
VTDCLNFGNPERPTVAWQLTEAIDGLAEACRALDVPIVSGNVSLYNETAGRAIPPTPTVGMVGLLEDVTLALGIAFTPDCAIVLLGSPPRSLDGFPHLDLEAERRLGDLLRDLAARRVLRSAQDVSDGGLAIALAECALAADVGATITPQGDPELALRSEDQGRAIITTLDAEPVLSAALSAGVPATVIGATGGTHLTVEGAFSHTLEALREAWESQLD